MSTPMRPNQEEPARERQYNQIICTRDSSSLPADEDEDEGARGSYYWVARKGLAPSRRRRRRKWRVFQGRNKFYCDGRIMMARQSGVFYLTLVLIPMTSGLFFTFDCPFLASNLSPAVPAVGGVLFLFVMGMLFRVSFTDPGVLPRATPHEAADLERQIDTASCPGGPGHRTPPRTREVQINGQTVKLKYCFTCKIFRPPRTSHCSLCDNCVERFDHHCPWLFIPAPGSEGSVRGHVAHEQLQMNRPLLASPGEPKGCCFHIRDHIGAPGSQCSRRLDRKQRVPHRSMATASCVSVSVVVCFFSVWSIVGLSGFHTYLISSNQTTNEDVKGAWSRKRGKDIHNPYSYGSILTNCCAALCGPLPPSLIDRRGLIQSDDPQPLSHSNGTSLYTPTPLYSHMCDQDQCIQSTKFVLQAATPLLQADPVVLAPLSVKTPLGPCPYLTPSQPSLPPPSSSSSSSTTTTNTPTPGLGCRDAETRCPHHHHHHRHHLHHHFVGEDTPPSPPSLPPPPPPPPLAPPPSPPPPPPPPCPAHSHAYHGVAAYDPASQDSLHDSSVRGLVKLSTV
ncbi:hypothetical protein NHX12_026322 [Muraenolepis orangiensis]|uniref:Palmitoyltransferase n=1 Tax=Muraenolepis orangiensis TaxID=630683 RepID=A0A9Q0EIE0_9TELE|nr:hypothetical protein NHX12_026322 [Muraenolepis orangiensis]